jgi:hypothetical protein
MKQGRVYADATMSTRYAEVLNQASHLSPAEQTRLLEELAALIRCRMHVQPGRSLMELQGLGKEVWEGVDAQAYVDQERGA